MISSFKGNFIFLAVPKPYKGPSIFQTNMESTANIVNPSHIVKKKTFLLVNNYSIFLS